MENKEFRISSNLEDIPMDVFKLYYENAQHRMADFHQQANDTTNRAYQLITVFVGILSLLCGYLYTNWEISKPIMAILAIAIGLAISTCIILKIIFPRLYIPLGRSPKELQIDYYAQFLKQENYTDDIKLKFIIKDELQILQTSINSQREKNERRTFLFTLSLIAAICGILASAVIVLI